jgi:PAS domain S-box-containing protein
LFELSLQMLCIAGLDGYFKRVNPAFQQTLGYTPAELLSRPFVDLVHPEDREATLSELDKLAAGIPTVSFENRYRAKDGSYHWLAWTAMPQKDEGLIYATALDITRRKHAEELFRGLLEAAPDATVISDGEGKITLVNAAAERTFGYQRDELVGQPVEILVPERLRGIHSRHSEEYRANPRIRLMGGGKDFSARRKDGSEFPAEISLSWLHSEEGIRVFSAIRDVSERKRAEGQLLKSEGQLLKREGQLRVAQTIQEHLLPDHVPVVEGFEFAGALYPAEYAAGDCFDYLAMADGSVGVTIGDVSGHGIGPALVMASAQTLMRMLAETTNDVAKILVRANAFLAKETEDGRFITMLLGRLDAATRTFTYVNAGHPPAYLLDRSGNVKHRLESTSLPLAVMPEIACPSALSITMDPGDVLVLLTDGILEAGTGKELFGSSRTLEAIRANCRASPAEIIDGLYRAACEFSRQARLPDDATLVVIRALDSSP